MNRKQSVIIVGLLALVAFTGYLAIQLNSPIYDANAPLDDKSAVTMKETKASGGGFFVEQRLTRDRSKATAYQTLQNLIDDENAPKEEREKASDQYRTLALTSEREVDLESKLKGKGFEDVICFIDGNKVKVFIKSSKELNESQIKLIKDEVLSSTKIKDVEITVKK
ncbi:SpoIIIAH-like family protein [Hathewaya histolytica]|uniref:Stage III sporulation protein AH n=1 Tax=Hathewaya histolytica TaxID=1498 RepID=A0A4U9R9A1_HATHI|nr:SpoIIIAH-like family protein [Hathewaya histolytica]VTQ88152.1 stage III sporulation protein AH [Hathewaya histolytica]